MFVSIRISYIKHRTSSLCSLHSAFCLLHRCWVVFCCNLALMLGGSYAATLLLAAVVPHRVISVAWKTRDCAPYPLRLSSPQTAGLAITAVLRLILMRSETEGPIFFCSSGASGEPPSSAEGGGRWGLAQRDSSSLGFARSPTMLAPSLRSLPAAPDYRQQPERARFRYRFRKLNDMHLEYWKVLSRDRKGYEENTHNAQHFEVMHFVTSQK